MIDILKLAVPHFGLIFFALRPQGARPA